MFVYRTDMLANGRAMCSRAFGFLFVVPTRYVKKKNTREHTRLHIAVDMHSFPRWHLKVKKSMVPHPTAIAI
ncbi:hypothetical protein B0O79_2832 [Flavobacteriaceae bacterium MAR_2009_75]|nr:hypothetical protein B0O79_2832 [Flavobacteriaceae bacterium MAR_2009_75]